MVSSLHHARLVDAGLGLILYALEGYIDSNEGLRFENRTGCSRRVERLALASCCTSSSISIYFRKLGDTVHTCGDCVRVLRASSLSFSLHR